MLFLGYRLALPFIYLISLLPFPLLYGLSDLLYLLVYRAIGYRRKVVMTNLRNAFPEKSEAELHTLARGFYRFLCDVSLETLKGLTISRKQALRHCFINEAGMRVFDGYAEQGQNIIIVMGHWGNWEWAGRALSIQAKQREYAIYHPLKNPYFDRLFNRMRTRFGQAQMIPMQDTFREMVKNRQVLSATAFIADQTPPKENAYWTTFLNQDTPVFKGTETIARKMNYPIVYASVKRTRRGYYEISIEVLETNPASTPEGEITERHTRRLEQDILSMPETWLWSHRRWKHKR